MIFSNYILPIFIGLQRAESIRN